MGIFKDIIAKFVEYNNSVSGLAAENVQDAIDEIGAGTFSEITIDILYFGDKDTNGSWRLIRNGNNLQIERRESGIWEAKQIFTP
jgi:hypothetical protein